MIERLNRLLGSLLQSRFRISTQLYATIGGAVALTISASLVGWFSFDNVGELQRRVNELRFPELEAAFGVAQYSGALVAAAPRLTTAENPEDFETVAAGIAEDKKALEDQLAILERQDAADERFRRIRAHADTLISNIRAIETDMSVLFDLNDQSSDLRTELMELQARLQREIFPAVDDQFFYTRTGHRTLGEPPAPRWKHFSEAEFDRFRHLTDLLADANTATQLLESAFTVSDAFLIEPLREKFEASRNRIERSLSTLEGSRLGGQVTSDLQRLFELGTGDKGCLNLLVLQLRHTARQRDLLARNQEIARDLVAEADELVKASQASAAADTQESTQAIQAGRIVLVAITGLSIVGAVLIAWLIVGRILLRRLALLSQRMRRMASGELEGKVEIEGRDEVADMAAALEVFRRHALEVQRLNLVEKLAEELRGKNEQLESVLADLRKAQDQIVMREKLAALGELTAGVAHEIKNPLNFVKNFSESSEELLEELQEVIEEEGDKLSKDDRELVEELIQDLTDNLKRIHSHGERANRIVHDMLMMGRGSGEWQMTEVNSLLDEHTRLAYHSARATDPDFQLHMEMDLDPETGEFEVVPQDIGRVFLNMVGNACYATDQKRRAAAEAGEPPSAYMPTLWVTTRRNGDRIQVRIKDNGNGIPAEIVDKIFNPFFTTKPTDQGTGLGLALSNDIVREHGGSIRVETEPGEFTEMTVEVPVMRSVAMEEAPAEQLG